MDTSTDIKHDDFYSSFEKIATKKHKAAKEKEHARLFLVGG